MNAQEKGVPGEAPQDPNQKPAITSLPATSGGGFDGRRRGNLEAIGFKPLSAEKCGYGLDGHDNPVETPPAAMPARAAAPVGPTPSTGHTAIEAPTGPQPLTLTCMQQVKRWLLWRSEANADPTKKPRKVPYYTNGQKRHGATDTPEDWAQLVSYEAAVAATRARPGFYTGLAFALGPDDYGGHWQGIDLDSLDRARLQESAASLPGYVEISPSGAGLHAIGRGRLFATLGNNRVGIEAYASGRYFTFTGNQVKDEPIRCIADFVEQSLAPMHAKGSVAKNGGQGVSAFVEHIDPRIVNDLRSALNAIPADPYDIWARVGLALKPYGNVGKELWLTWSERSTKYSPREAEEKWEKGFGGSRSTYAAVFAEAQRHEWINPNSNAARGVGAGRVGVPAGDRSIVSRTLDKVKPRALDYAWVGWIPKGYITLTVGETGSGKTTVLASIVARISTGEPWPGETVWRTPGQVLWLGSEDGMEDMTVPRLIAASANLSNVTEIQGVVIDGKRNTFSMQDDIEMVRALLRQARDKGSPYVVVIVDPITSYLAGAKLRKVDLNDAGQMRTVLEPWMAVAQEFDIGIVAVTHLAKDTTRLILHRVLGSGAFAATCRSLIYVVSLPDVGIYAKAMLQEKMNLPDHPSGGWRFETEKVCIGTDDRNGKEINATRAVWGEFDPLMTSATIVGKERGPKSKIAMPFGLWVSALFKSTPDVEWRLSEEVRTLALREGVATESWWNDHSKEFLEKANMNGTWFCRLRGSNETPQTPSTTQTP